MRVSVDGDAAAARLDSRWPRRQGVFAPIFDAAIADGYKRLMAPSLEREASRQTHRSCPGRGHQRLCQESRGPAAACRVLARSGRSPLPRATAPAARSPSWTRPAVCRPRRGPTPPSRATTSPAPSASFARLVKKDGVNTIVIGNGTASRETEEVVSEFIAEQAPNLRYTIVNEAGASVYSASELASQEYPDLDVTVRGAMSLGRRLQDPLAELGRSRPSPSAWASTSTTLTRLKLPRAPWATWWRTSSTVWAST